MKKYFLLVEKIFQSTEVWPINLYDWKKSKKALKGKKTCDNKIIFFS